MTETASKRATAGAAYMAFACLSFAAMATLIKFLAPDIPWQQTVFVRSVLGIPFLWIAYRNTTTLFRWNHKRLLLLRSVCGFIAMLCYFYALEKIPLGTAVMLAYTSPLHVGWLALIFLPERPSPLIAPMLLIGFLGVWLVADPTSVVNAGTIAGALCGLFAGQAYIFVRKLRTTDHPDAIVMAFAVFSAVVSLPLTIPYWVWPTASQWGLLLCVGITSTIAQALMTRAYRDGMASIIASLGYLTVVFGMISGVIFFDETILGDRLIGACFIILGGLGTVWFGTQRRPLGSPRKADLET